MTYESTKITAVNGTPFTVRIVREGEIYGRGIRHSGVTPTVEFYDARFDDERFTPGLGRFISRYSADQFVALHGGDAPRRSGTHFTLNDGIPEWTIDGASMETVVAWLTERLASAAPREEPAEADLFEHRGLSVNVFRTDEPYEPPGDDPEADGPFATGDWYVAVAEWGLQTAVSFASARNALQFGRAAVDAVLNGRLSPSEALSVSGVEPVPLDGSVTVSVGSDRGASRIFLRVPGGHEETPPGAPGWYCQDCGSGEAPTGPFGTAEEAAGAAKADCSPTAPRSPRF